MKMGEMLRRINSPFKNYVDREIVEQTIGGVYYDLDLEKNGFRQRPIITWLCTDTWVGWNAIYLGDELICITKQTARKNPTEIEWVSQEVFDKIRAFLFTLIPKEDQPTVDLIRFEEEIGEPSYPVGFTNQLLANEVLYQGKRVKVKRWTREDDRDYLDQEIQIEIDGEIKVVNLKEILIPIELKDE